MVLTAVQQIRKMRGGAQSHLMRCRAAAGAVAKAPRTAERWGTKSRSRGVAQSRDSGAVAMVSSELEEEGEVVLGEESYWVVKFQNNPQHVRVLANEYLGTRIAEAMGLPVPDTAVVEVSEWLIDNTEELRNEWAGESEKVSAGLQFGSRYVVDPKEGQAYDYLPEMFFDRIKNLKDFWGVLCFDKWTCQANGRQAVYWKVGRERKYNVTFVDQGYCFNAQEWSFPDAPLRGVYARNAVYEGVTGWESFEPWLTRLKELPIEKVWKMAEEMPPEWYEYDDAGLWRVIEELEKRKAKVPELIHDFRRSSRNPFPGWVESVVVM